jgi:hypothetical protein
VAQAALLLPRLEPTCQYHQIQEPLPVSTDSLAVAISAQIEQLLLQLILMDMEHAILAQATPTLLGSLETFGTKS